ncbi:hypothetical protein IT400_03930 [Candidatus Nomurabacteria bacterium]|nr:hypothetical protein [Candidatus Nomurabacteria bacterium]
MKKQIVDLDKIALSLPVYTQYKYHFVQKIGEWYTKSGRIKNIKISDIPDEQFRILENGDGEIFVQMPDGIEIVFPVPKGHWFWHQILDN